MPRKTVPLLPENPYHISARCHNQEWLELPMPTVWSIMEDYLFFVSNHYHIRIHSFVLMSNHFHLLATVPNGNISQALLYFMRETSKEITRRSGRINQTYGIRNHKTQIGNYHYFMNSYKYVYRNPVRAKICNQAEEYPYSTLNGLCGLNRLSIPLVEDSLLFTPEFDQKKLAWLNTPSDPEHEKEMHQALRRPEMSFKALRKNGKPSELEKLLI